MIETNVSEKRAVSFFRAEDGESMHFSDAGFYQAIHTAT
jgi:hypothetical protein